MRHKPVFSLPLGQMLFVGLLALIVNIIFWGTLLWVGLSILRHFSVI